MNDLRARMDQVRRDLLATIDGVAAAAAEPELPAPPPALAACRSKLASEEFLVIVVGEVKRGKSSFVNALIGQDILPTDVDVATSQVFRITRAPAEGYRLRFEDGSSREVGRSDLPRFGSQVVADAEGEPRLDQIIKWIEVDVPVRFLPEGIRLLDTPGLGGLYPLHAEITQRHIPTADAVIFVIDSTRPIIEEELNYLEEILKKPVGLFFIQTKIDLFRSRQWQEVQTRNEAILRERFGDRLPDLRVWPISSRLLRDAASRDDPDYEIASRHRELAPALQVFLFRVAGLARAAEALVIAQDYHEQSAQILAGRHHALTEATRQEQESTRRELAGRKERFLNEWGDRGQKRGELKLAVQRISELGKRQIGQYLGRGGDLEASLLGMVEGADSPDALRAVGDRLAESTGAMAMKAWRTVTDRSWEQVLAILGDFQTEADQMTAPYAGASGDLPQAAAAAPPVNRDWYAKMKGARLDFMTGVWGGGVGVGIGGGLLVTMGILAAPVVAPLAAVAALVTGFFAVFRGAKAVDHNQLRASKQEMARYAHDVRQKISHYYLGVDFSGGNFSLVDEYFQKLEAIANERVDELTKQKGAEAEAEIARMKRQAELDEQRRREEAERLRGHMVAWHALGKRLAEAGDAVETLDRSLGERSQSVAGAAGA